jgi:hypothetical protein
LQCDLEPNIQVWDFIGCTQPAGGRNYVKQVDILYVSTGKLNFRKMPLAYTIAWQNAMLGMNSNMHRMLVIHCELRMQRMTLAGTIRMHYPL